MNKSEAVKMIQSNEAVCVIWNENSTFTSKERGIKPLLMWIAEDKTFFKGKNIADKVIGKAAALLFVYGGAEKVHAIVMSSHALSVFKTYGVKVTYDHLTDYIVNRDKTGMCPMESRVLNIESPEEAYANLSQIL